MSIRLGLILDLLMGVLLGGLYFAHLWQTTQRLCAEGHSPWMWLLQIGLRSGLLMLILYLLAGNNWQSWLACLGGWLIGRQILVSRIQYREAR